MVLSASVCLSRRAGPLCGSILLAATLSAGKDEAGLGKFRYPGAEARPEIARAVEAYYRPGLARNQSLRAAVFETLDDFVKVSAFYGRQMDEGKWGWRTKTRVLRQQTETLSFMRVQLRQARSQEPGLAGLSAAALAKAETLKPLFGDLAQPHEEFRKRLEQLHDRHAGVTFHVAEGTRTVRSGRARQQIRVTVERPYIDLARMIIVDRTRLILVEVADE